MDDIRHRDLSQIPEDEMSPEERRELKRRFEEFVGLMRRSSSPNALAVKPPKKKLQRWDPTSMGKRRSS